MSRKLFSPLPALLLLSIVGLLPSHGQNREILGEYRIGVVGRDQNDAIYQVAHLGAMDAARELSRQYSIDIEILHYTPLLEQGGSQAASLAELFIEDAEGLMISPNETEAVRTAVEFARNQGQEIVFFESDLAGIEPLGAVIADEVAAGRMAGEAILNVLPTKGRVAILTSKTPDARLEARLKGARAALGYRRIETIVETAPNYNAAIATIRATEEADRNDLIKGWVFLDDWPLAGLPALPWQPGVMPAVAIQSSPTAFLYLDQGYLSALIAHPYYEWGYRSVEILVDKLFNTTTPDVSELQTTPTRIDFRNIETYRTQWKEWLR